MIDEICHFCGIRPVTPASLKKRHHICAACRGKRYKENANRYRQNRRRKIRQQIFEHYGHQCHYCGTTDNLQLDHVNGDGSLDVWKDGVRHGGTAAWEQARREGFPNRYQILCRRCNRAKSNMPEPEFKEWIALMYQYFFSDISPNRI